jgi:hypothetical protein
MSAPGLPAKQLKAKKQCRNVKFNSKCPTEHRAHVLFAQVQSRFRAGVALKSQPRRNLLKNIK